MNTTEPLGKSLKTNVETMKDMNDVRFSEYSKETCDTDFFSKKMFHNL